MMAEAAKPIDGKITKFGMAPNGEMDGTLTIDVQQAGGFTSPVVIKGSEAQRTKMFPKMSIGDTISVYVRTDGSIQGGITVKDKGKKEFVPGSSYAGEGPRPISKYPTKDEQRIVETSEKQNYILWQSCMKIAVETEKFFVGGVEDRQQTVKEIITVTNALYEASQRKMRGLPPIEEVRGA